MLDVIVRKVYANCRDVSPKHSVPAKGNGSTKSIDRWVLGKAIEACRDKRGMQLFVRPSTDSVPDRSLAEWIRLQLPRRRACRGSASSSKSARRAQN
jgi:hypothetical protein